MDITQLSDADLDAAIAQAQAPQQAPRQEYSLPQFPQYRQPTQNLSELSDADLDSMIAAQQAYAPKPIDQAPPIPIPALNAKASMSGISAISPAAPPLSNVQPLDGPPLLRPGADNPYDIGGYIERLPVMQEMRTQTPWQTAQNIARGVPYGLAQIADVSNLALGAVPRAIEGGVHMMINPLTGTPETPITDAILGGKPITAQRYRKKESAVPGYGPETFKLGGSLGQLVLPTGFGPQAATLGKAALVGALENAITGGIGNAGEQLGETGKVDPLQMALAMGISAPLGAAASSLGFGAKKVLEKLGPELAQEKLAIEAQALGGVPAANNPYLRANQPDPALMGGVAARAGQEIEPMMSGSVRQSSGRLGDYNEMVRRGLIEVQPEDAAVHSVLSGGVVVTANPTPSYAPKPDPALMGGVAAQPQMPNTTGNVFGSSRRFMQGNSGEAVNVQYPGDTERLMSDYAAMAIRQRGGSNRAQFNVDKTRLVNMQKELESRGVSPSEAIAYHKDLKEQVRESFATGERSFVAPKHAVGDMRYTLNRDDDGKLIKGFARAQEGVSIEQIPDNILSQTDKQKVRNLAQAQLLQKVAERHRDSFAQALHDNGTMTLSSNGSTYSLKPRKGLQKLSYEGRLKYDEIKYSLSDALEQPKGGGPRVQVDQAAIDEPFHYEFVDGVERRIEYKPPTGDASKDALRLKYLVEAEKAWSGRAKAARKEVGDVLASAQKRMQAIHPQQHLMINIPVGPHKIMIEPTHARVEKTFLWKQWQRLAKENNWSSEQQLVEMQRFFEQRARELGGAPEDWMRVAAQSQANLEKFTKAAKNIKQLYGYVQQQPPKIVKDKSHALIAGLAGYAALQASNDEAQAYTEGSDAGVRANNLARALGTTVGVAALLYAASKGSGITPKVFRKWIESGVAASAKTLGDSLDHIGTLDKELGTDMAQQYWAMSSAIAEGRRGLVIKSMDDYQGAREALRQGLVSAQDALSGGGVFGVLPQGERSQIVTEHLTEKTLAKRITAFKEQAQQWYKQQSPEDQLKYRPEMFYLDAMVRSLQPSGAKDPIAALVAAGNEYLFRGNLEFHGTNLTDPLIAAGSRIGPLYLGRAYNLLATNRQVQRLFRNSNFVGGVKAERQLLSAKGGWKAPWEGFDLGSDEFNANRVMLASFLRSFKKSQVLHGTKASEMDYLTAMMTGQPVKGVSPDAVADGWAQAMDDSLRTLGVDPLGLNRNFFTAVPGARYFAAFVNQPARISRLVSEYVANREYGKMATFLTVMTLIGGRAAIPRSVRLVWESADPDSAKAAESTLDQLTIFNTTGNMMLTGNPFSRQGANPMAAKVVGLLQTSLADKIGYDAGAVGIPAYLGFGSQHPSLEAAANSSTEAADLIRDIRSGDSAKEWKAAKNAVMLAGMLGLYGHLPIVKAIPAGMVSRALSTTEQVSKNSIPVSYYSEDGKPYGKKKEIRLRELGPLGWLLPVADKVIPGKPYLVDASQQAQLEKSQRKAVKADRRPLRQMMYQDPLFGMR